jgi:hypothetical protein
MSEPAETRNQDDMRQGSRIAMRFAIVFGAVTVLLVIVLVMLGSEWRDAISTAVAKGRRLRALHYGYWGVWWGGAGTAAMSAVLALTSFWWGRVQANPLTERVAVPPMTTKAWLGLLGILAVAGVLRWDHAGLTFYNDEAQAFRRYMGGQHLRQPDGTVKWNVPPWWETVWLNKAANNSMPYSVTSRFCYGTWQKLSGAPEGTVNERAVRLPVVLASMAGLVMLWLVMRRLMPGTGACWWVLLLAALHPWHLRYSSEARGHGLLLLGLPLCVWFLQRALEDDRWRWWIGMGVAQFFCLWSFQGCAGFFVVFNLMLVGGVVWPRGHGWQWRSAVRPIVGLTVGAMITLPVLLPLMKQLTEAIENLPSLKGTMDVSWWRDLGSLIFAGLPWVDDDVTNPNNTVLSRLMAQHPWVWLLAPAVLLPLGVGLWKCAKRGLAGTLAVIAAPVAAVLMVVALSLRGTFLYPWYLIFVLPGFLLAWAAGAAGLTRLARPAAVRWGVMTVLLLPVAGFGWVNAETLKAPKENLRGLAQAIPSDALHASLFSDVDVYDGDVVALTGKEGLAGMMSTLDSLIKEAREKSRPLYVSFSRRSNTTEFDPFYQRVEGGGEFEHVADFLGRQQAQFTHHLYRLRP